MTRSKWTDRTFTFDYPEGWLPNILERLRGTMVRLKEMTASLPEDLLNYKPDGKWSIKENIGHLSDLEDLHEGRIDDMLERKEVLRPADILNPRTTAANHNQKSLNELLDDLTTKRERLIARLLALDDETQQFKSLHPRLHVLMRPVDIAYFTAEHDDHHLADIRTIINHGGAQ